METTTAPDNEAFAVLCQTIGASVLMWAQAENALEFCLAIFLRDFPQLDGGADFPVSLKRKLQLLKRGLATIDVLKPVQDQGVLLHQKFMSLKEYRHDLIHAVALGIRDDLAHHALRVMAKAGRPIVGSRYRTVNDILVFCRNTEDLAELAVNFFHRVSEIMPDPI